MELEDTLDELAEQGLGLVAITYDTPEVIRHFAQRVGITYPLLADPDSKIIGAFDILNTNIPEDHEWYGVPFPGTYVVDANGIVKAKYFEQDHRERYTADSILTREFGVAGARRVEVQTDHLKLTAYSSDDEASSGNRITLVLDVELPDRMHIYAPGVEGYTASEFNIAEDPLLITHETEFPGAEILHLPAIDERVPVFHHTVRIRKDVTISARARQDEIRIGGSFKYQACDDTICYLPAEVPVDFVVKLSRHDGSRAPVELRRKGP